MPSPYPRTLRRRCPALAMLPILAMLLLAPATPARAGQEARADAGEPIDSALLAIAEDICLDLMAQESVHRRLNSSQLAALTGINPRLSDGGTSLTFFENGIAYCRSGDKALWTAFTLEAGSPPAIVDALDSPPIRAHEVWFHRIAPPSTATPPSRLQAPDRADDAPAGMPRPSGGGPRSIIPLQAPATGPGDVQ